VTPITKSGVAKAASTIALLAGIWFFISPWVYGVSPSPDAWNSWIVGGLIIILAIIRLASPPMLSWVAWVNCPLGVWTFASPWIYGYTGSTGRFVNSLVVGIIVFIAAIRSATTMAIPRTGPQQPAPHHP